MKYYAKKNIPGRLVQAREIIITVATDEAIRNSLASTGYTESRFQEMQKLLGNAERLETNQQVQLGRQTAATQRLNTLMQSMLLKFVGDRKIVRHVLKGNAALSEELRMHIKTEKRKEALVRQMTHFYEEVVKHPALMEHLRSEFNLTAELFKMRLGDVDAIKSAMHVQQYRMGLFHVATRNRQEAMKRLDTWMSAFIGMARQAFRGKEEYLTKLSIHVRSKSRSEK